MEHFICLSLKPVVLFIAVQDNKKDRDLQIKLYFYQIEKKKSSIIFCLDLVVKKVVFFYSCWQVIQSILNDKWKLMVPDYRKVMFL